MLPERLTDEMVDAACVVFAEHDWIPYQESPETWDHVEDTCRCCKQPKQLRELEREERLAEVADTRSTVRAALLGAFNAAGKGEDDARVASGV